MGINQYSDMLRSEIITDSDRDEDFCDEDSYLYGNRSTYRSRMNVALPNSIDWRTDGAVTGVKNLGSHYK